MRSITSDCPRSGDRLQAPFEGLFRAVPGTGTNSEGRKSRISGMEPSQFKKAIGTRLRKAREDKGWSLREMSVMSGGAYPKSTIYNYEQGQRTPDPWDAKALAELLGIKAGYLM